MSKKIIIGFITAILLVAQTICAQTSPPLSISYQGIARNASGDIIPNQLIGLNFIIHQGSALGTPVFSEPHTVTTNSLGLFSLSIGSTNITVFQGINWANGPYFLEVQMDPSGGTSYNSVGTQQFVSVPYALFTQHARIADSAIVSSSVPGWKLKGNNGTVPPADYLGTSDYTDLIFKTNAIERMHIFKDGQINIGVAPTNVKRLFTVSGTPIDTILAAFHGLHSFGTGILITNPTSFAGLLLKSGPDTAFVGFNNSKKQLELFSHKKIVLGGNDTTFIFSNTNTSIGSKHNINLFTTDTVKIAAETQIGYTATLPSSALQINYGNSSSAVGNSAGIWLNHTSASSQPSHGIYINNQNAGAGGPIVGIGSYAAFNFGDKRGLESYMNGGGTNIAAFLDASGGTNSLNGYSDWAIYSNNGNVLINNGHLVFQGSMPLAVTSYSMTSVSVATNSTDNKGNFALNNMLPSYPFIVDITFNKPYANPPIVILSIVDNANNDGQYIKYIIKNTTTTGFTVGLNNTASWNISGVSFNYIVVE